jgi:iron complex outermembrane recepter protein
MRLCGLRLVLLFCLAVVLARPALAQRADDNAVTAAEDAFGATIGNESIGLYSTSQVRGFSPVTAGNVRIEGLYFDRQGTVPPRLVEGSTIRVGLSAQSHPFPAPTGIVDYRLQKAGDERLLSIVTALNPYSSPSIELDAKLPIVRERLGLAAGISYAHEEYYDGADAPFWRAAVVPRWRPTEDIEVTPFWSVVRGRDEEVAPTIVTGGSWLPPEIERRRYFGQQWSDVERQSANYGVVTKARMGRDWALAAGIFESVYNLERGFAELYVGTTPDGTTRELVIADPQQRYASTSGELRLTRSIVQGPRLHVLHASFRAREQENRYGGSTAPIDLGVRRLGESAPVPRPVDFEFSERTHDTVRQSTVALGYEGRWRGIGEASLGLQRTDYEKRIDQPDLPSAATRDDPWLVNATIAAHVSEQVAVYASYTRGLEESGIAPADAANRNEALPAIRTRQIDAGVRWAVTPALKLVAGAFEVEKPYFTTDERNVFTTLGTVRHRGVELSFAGTPTEMLSVVVGAVLMEPRVTGEAVETGRVSEKPVGQTSRHLRANAEYRLPMAPALSFDVAVANYGDRKASRDGRSEVPGYTLIDVGARYRFKLADMPATLRVQAANVTDVFIWNVNGNNSFGLTDERRYSAQLTVDWFF